MTPRVTESNGLTGGFEGSGGQQVTRNTISSSIFEQDEAVISTAWARQELRPRHRHHPPGATGRVKERPPSPEHGFVHHVEPVHAGHLDERHARGRRQSPAVVPTRESRTQRAR